MEKMAAVEVHVAVVAAERQLGMVAPDAQVELVAIAKQVELAAAEAQVVPLLANPSAHLHLAGVCDCSPKPWSCGRRQVRRPQPHEDYHRYAQ